MTYENYKRNGKNRNQWDCDCDGNGLGDNSRTQLTCPPGHYCGLYTLIRGVTSTAFLSVHYDFDPITFEARLSLKYLDNTIAATTINPRNPRWAIYGDVRIDKLHIKDYLIFYLEEARPNFVTLVVSGLGVCVPGSKGREDCVIIRGTEIARFPIF
ncbi:hypothetical protein HPT25_22720 [Bacillus sp. BRMEA1]|nr:hypothetical protein [Neobacillus endophyticus]